MHLKVGLATAAALILALATSQAQTSPAAAQQALVTKYCATCHSDRVKTAGLALQSVDATKPTNHPEIWEKVIRKIRVGAMPPQGAPRPEKAELDGFAKYLETSIDQVALAKPNPGRASLHRLNRTEYANAVKDLLALDIDGEQYLPPDDESYGFDNMADVLNTSPALLERYMSASWKISRIAVGNMKMLAETSTYRVKPDLSQDEQIEGLPLGTRGGTSFVHNFPLDGEYEIRVRLWRDTADIIRGIESRHVVEVSIDGNVIKVVAVGGKEDAEGAFGNSGVHAAEVDQRMSIRLPVKAGPHTVVATFRRRSAAQDDDILQPFMRTNLDPVGYQGQPVVDRVSVTGPYNAKGAGDTPSRRAIFICKPTGADEVPCAKQILSKLAKIAYRRPVTANDQERLLAFFQRGRNEGGSFDAGIEAALQLVLASPEFLFRFEANPAGMAPDTVYRLSDLELASRLSFFLWSTGPDEALLNVATAGQLKNPTVLEQQVRRMLADPKAEALVSNFAGQWLFLRNLKTVNPNFESFPDFDDNLRQSMKRETEMLVDAVIHEDRNVLDLLNADFTFVNERLARHYGMKGIYGNDFRRVKITDENRRGLLGQASILTVTSYATRTSPVQRGKWILTNLLGTPPPPPPPNIPALEDNKAGVAPKALRERMELHRSNAVCASCHRMMDPIGFSLENFDAVGQYRVDDDGVKIDSSGVMFDGSKVNSAAALRAMLMSRPEVFVGVMTERMMTYAIGRGVEYSDMPVVRSILRDSAKNNYRFSSMVMGIVKSPEFQMRRRPADSPGTETARVALEPRP